MSSRTTHEAHGLTVIRHERQTLHRVHEFLTTHPGLIILLAIADGGAACYLILTPAHLFAGERTWAGAFGIFGSLDPLGWIFAAAALGSLARLIGATWIARLLLLLALLPWGAIVASFAVAWTQTRLGFLTALLAAVVLVLHLASVGHITPDDQ